MKIFISYSSADLPLAERVFGEMVRGGATAFQYGRSETIGKPSWEQVLDWISESDVFIVLVSESALASKAVREEIGQAHYSYINHGHPDRIVAAIVAKGAKPPRLIERFARVDMLDYDAGMNRLMSQLRLERKPRAAPASLALPDWASLFQEFKRRHPAPTPAAEFAAKAERIVANYDAVKPPEVKGPERARHLDSILAGLADAPRPRESPARFGKIDSLFLGYDPGKRVSTPAQLAESLLHWERRKSPLDAPVLAGFGSLLSWSPVPGATGYALERSETENFATGSELYRGAETRFTIPVLKLPLQLLTPHYFRVKAIGGVFMADSGWSNVVPWRDHSLWSKGITLRPKLETPALKLMLIPSILEAPSLSWSAVDGAAEYVLERSDAALFSSPHEAYKGPGQTYIDFGQRRPLTLKTSPLSALLLKNAYYRVKAAATATRDESDWSNVVRWSDAP